MCKFTFFICLTLKLISNIASNRFIFHKESNILIPTILLFPFIKAAAIAQVFDQLGDIFAGTEYNRDYMKMKSEINLDDEPVKHKEKLAEHADKELTSKSKDKTQNSLLDSSADGVANDLVSMDGSAIDLDNVASKVQNLKVMVPKTDDISFSSFQPFTVSKVTDCGVMPSDSIKSFVTKTLEPKLIIPPDDGCTNGMNNLNMQNLPFDCCSNMDGDVLISCLANCLCNNSPNQSSLPLFQQNTPLQNECKPNTNITCNQNQYNRNGNTPSVNNQLQISNTNNRPSNYPSTGQGRNNLQRVPKQIPNSPGNVLTRFTTLTKSSLVTNTILKYITSTFNVYNRMPVKTRTSYSYIVSTYSRIVTQPVYSTVTQPIYSTFTQPVYSTIIQPVYSTITQPIYSTVVQPVTYTSTLPVNHVRTITKPVNVVKTVTTPVYYQQILTVPSNDNLEIKGLLHDLQNRLKPMQTLSAQNLEIQRLNNKLHSVYEMIRNGSATKNYASECNGKQCLDKPKTVVESRPCEGKTCSSACTSTKSSSNKTRTIMAKTCYEKRCNECPNSECNNCESTSCQSCQMSSTDPGVCTSKTGDKCPTSDVTITIGPAQSIESTSTDRTKSKTHSILTESAISKSKSESDMTNNINTTICVTDKDNNISCTVINSNTDYPKPSGSIPSHTTSSKIISSDKADKTCTQNDSNTNKRTSTYYHTNTKVEKNTCDCPQTSSKECPLDMQCDKYKTSKHHTCSSDKISTVSATCEDEPDVADAYVEDNGDVRYVLLSDILSEMDV